MLKLLAFLFALLPLCINAAEVTLIVSVPSNTPIDARLSLGGDFNGWNPANPRYKMKKLDSGKYQYVFTNIKLNSLLNFKITRGSWQTVEVNKEGLEKENRSYLIDKESQLIETSVTNWADLPEQ